MLKSIIAIIAFSSFAMAKIQVYKSQDAIRTVLENKEIRELLKGQQQYFDSFLVSASASGDPLNRQFMVQLQQAVKTNLGTRYCNYEVQLVSEIRSNKKPELPQSRAELNSKLRIISISDAICNKESGFATRIQP